MARLGILLAFLLLSPLACGRGALELSSLRSSAGLPIRHIQVDPAAVRNPQLLPGRSQLVATVCARLRTLGGGFSCGASGGAGGGWAILLLDVSGYESEDYLSRPLICVAGRLTLWDGTTRELLWSGGKGVAPWGGVCAREVRRVEEDLGERAWEEFLRTVLPAR
ncbi:MAG: hypothetical protein ACE5JJ_02590 [Nitrospinota bacterium]